MAAMPFHLAEALSSAHSQASVTRASLLGKWT